MDEKVILKSLHRFRKFVDVLSSGKSETCWSRARNLLLNTTLLLCSAKAEITHCYCKNTSYILLRSRGFIVAVFWRPAPPELSLNKLHVQNNCNCDTVPDSLYWQRNDIFSHQVFDFWCSPTVAFGSAAGFKFRKHNAKSHHIHFWLRISAKYLDKIQLTFGPMVANHWACGEES